MTQEELDTLKEMVATGELYADQDKAVRAAIEFYEDMHEEPE